MPNLVIYEDNEKLRKTLKLLFSGMKDIELLGSYSNCLNVATETAELQPDVVLMDIDMPGMSGIEGVSLVKEQSPETKVLMHTIFDDDDKIFRSLAAGADGYILKSASPMDLYHAVCDVTSGGVPMTPGVARKVLASFKSGSNAKREFVDLTDREMEILHMLTKGYTYKRISADCFISIDTTRTHIKNIYTKLHVNCSTEAVAKAVRMRLF
jgi:DNA-binding NarL/FixJ family response regulator